MEKRRNGAIWTWKIYKVQLPVTCGHLEGILSRERMAQGKPCFMVNKTWLTPTQFEKLGGKQSWKSWKKSIRCDNTPLERLIKEGHLQVPNHKRPFKKTNKSQFSSEELHHVNAGSDGDQDEDYDTVTDKDNKSTDLSDELQSVSTVLDGEEDFDEDSDLLHQENFAACDVTCYEELRLPVHFIFIDEEEDDDDDDDDEEEQMEQQSEGSSKMLFQVTCGALSGMLHKQRFASESRGKSIRTETCWMSPVEFVNKGSSQRNASWTKDIQWDGKPLSVLIEDNVLEIHPEACDCRVCSLLWEDEEKNDYECFICKSEDRQLVMCSTCPRSFHTTCHQPHVDDALLGDDQWQCTFCVFSLNQSYFYHHKRSLKCALSRKISQHMLESQYLLLRLCSADEKQIFTNPILNQIKDDSAVKTPVSLANVAEKVQNKSYQTVGEFVSDVQLIFSNCASYGRDNAELQATINSLQEFFDTEFKNVFDIQEESVSK